MKFKDFVIALEKGQRSIFEADTTTGGIEDSLPDESAPADQGPKRGKGKAEIEKTHTPEAIARILNKIIFSEPYVARMFSAAYTDWYSDSSCPTAGVSVKNGRIQFYYSPKFVAECAGNGTLYFLIKHELYHILRLHKERAMWKQAWGGPDHRIFNIAADTLINRDLVTDRSYASMPQIAPKGGWFLYDSDADMAIYNSVEKTINTPPKGQPAPAKKKKYTGAKTSEAVFKFLKKYRDDLPPEEPQEGDGEGEREIEVGHPIFDTKSKKFGKVSKIYKNGSYVWEEISKAEAEALAKQIGGK